MTEDNQNSSRTNGSFQKKTQILKTLFTVQRKYAFS